MASKPTLGVSACLIGQKVRYDGGHKHQRFFTETLSDHFEFKAICPEVDIGLGIPRPTIQLRQVNDTQIQLVNPREDGSDLTHKMRSYADQRVSDLGGLCGYLFKKDSPSCGMERVPVVINDSGHKVKQGVGIFAQTFMDRWPLIPTEEEGRLNDALIRENFFERVYALQRWRQIENPETNVEGFINFHARHKLMLMARGGSALYQTLGRLVAGTTRETLLQNRQQYIASFMELMAIKATRGRHVNVMQHIMGYFKNKLDADSKQELLALFDQYRAQEIPLVTPVTLLRHHLRLEPDTYLMQQHYLKPFPESLALRSHLY